MRWLLAMEAGVQLTRASAELRLRPATRTVAALGMLQTESGPDETVGEAKLLEAQRVGRAVARVARVLPWHPTCLRQALAAQRMLRRRNIASRLHLGVTHPSVGTAHAWVTVEDHAVVGRSGLDCLVPLAAFR